jgi:hypothetical protein
LQLFSNPPEQRIEVSACLLPHVVLVPAYASSAQACDPTTPPLVKLVGAVLMGSERPPPLVGSEDSGIISNHKEFFLF